MATNSTVQERNSALIQIAQADNRGFITSETTFAMIDLCTFGLIQRVAYEGPCMEDQRHDSLSNHDVYEITELGAKYLSAHMPMVDQPQPLDETTIVGEVSFYADGKPQDGTVVCGTDRFGYTVRGVNGKVYDEVQRGDIEPRLGDEIDNLPFSDLGELDDEDTKELPAITLHHTPCNPTRPTIGDAIKLPLDKLIDAALDPDNSEAYETLKGYDWASVPLWVLEIEREDVNTYKWDIWHELRKMDGGILLSNPGAVYKGREVDRAFNVMAILNKAIYSFHKGVGFNVEN